MGSYTVNTPKQAGWLVYINGLEIPVSSLSVQFGVWQMPTLTLNMVPHPILTRIGAEDRLQVAVFYLDHHWDPKNPEFRFLAEFEVVGWSYTNTPRARFITLSCVSQLQIFEQLHFFYISSLDDMATALSPVTASDPSIGKSVSVTYPLSLFLQGLISSGEVAYDNSGGDLTNEGTTTSADAFIKRPIDFVTNIFRALLAPISSEAGDDTRISPGSKAIPRSAASVPGKNFFARWLKMTGFNKRWAALPVLEDEGGDGCFPIVKATQDTNTLPALQQQIGQSVGNSGSAWQLLQQVLGYMYMEICTVPAPPAATLVKDTGRIVPRGGNLESATRVSTSAIPTFFVKPMCTFALPPSCNVVFPSMILNYSYQENYIRQPTRVYLGEQFISDIIAPEASGDSVTNLVTNLMVTGYPIEVRKRMQSLLNASPESTNKNFLLFAEEFYKGPVSKRMNAPPWMYMLQQMENANNDGKSAEDVAIIDEIRAQVGSESREDEASGLGVLFDTYAKTEYYRARYAERSGGATLMWNPYLVPGFPVAIFDQQGTGMDTMGYANTVTHSMSASDGGNMTTTVNLTFVRSMPEFVGITASDEDAALGLDISPSEAIPEVRDVFQKTQAAHSLYRRMLYREAPMKKSAVFNWRAMLDIFNIYGDQLDSTIDTNRIDETVQLKPKGEYKGLFESYDAAMRYASRPACTLKEYIEVWHGRSLTGLLEDGTVRGEYASFYSPAHNEDLNKGALFWGRIYQLIPGPGPKPPVTVTNMGPGPDYGSAGSESWTTVDASTGMPQTRENWDKKLEEYRKIVRSESGKIAPQV